jgi:hypothetical protein
MFGHVRKGPVRLADPDHPVPQPGLTSAETDHVENHIDFAANYAIMETDLNETMQPPLQLRGASKRWPGRASMHKSWVGNPHTH